MKVHRQGYVTQISRMNGFFLNTNRTNYTNEGAQTGLCHADFTDEWIFFEHESHESHE